MFLAVKRRGNKGQTSLEYLMLLSAAFISGYVVITGPIAKFTGDMLLDIRGGLQNVVHSGQWKKGTEIAPGDREAPGQEKRGKPLHL